MVAILYFWLRDSVNQQLEPGVYSQKLCGATSYNPYLICEENLRFFLPYLWTGKNSVPYLWRLMVAFVHGLIDSDEKVASSKKHT